jgi:hypothetical protein
LTAAGPYVVLEAEPGDVIASLRGSMMTAERTDAQTVTEHELEQCERANQTGRTPVVFVHGLWLPSSWEHRAALFEHNGYVALTPGWRADSLHFPPPGRPSFQVRVAHSSYPCATQ